MRFHEFTSRYQAYGRSREWSVEKFYNFLAEDIKKDVPTERNELQVAQAAAEWMWYRKVRPYYKVWPGIAKALLRMSLDCKLQDLPLPESKVFLVRFVVGQELAISGGMLNTMLIYHHTYEQNKQLFILANYTGPDGVDYCTNFIAISGDKSDTTIKENLGDMASPVVGEETVPSFANRADQRQEHFSHILRIALTLLILAKDKEFIKPDVLAADLQKYDANPNQALVQKARDRGVVGWRVGYDYEQTPHFRRPHLGLRWTGEKRAVPKIVPIKGSIVHRNKVVEVPTGFTLQDGTELEGVEPTTAVFANEMHS